MFKSYWDNFSIFLKMPRLYFQQIRELVFQAYYGWDK